jgi:hypothetical protein
MLNHIMREVLPIHVQRGFPMVNGAGNMNARVLKAKARAATTAK